MNKAKIWFHIKNQNREYYTPYTDFKTRFAYIGDGNSSITSPKDKCDFLNDNLRGGYEREGIFAFHDNKISTHTAIRLPDGIYRYLPADFNDDVPERLVPIDIRDDHYVHLGGQFEKVEVDIKTFLDNKSFYNTKGFLYKMGILLHSSPGQGKTAFIRKVISELVPKKSVVIFMPELPETCFIAKLNMSLEDRLKTFVFEELAANIDEDHGIEQLLNFLDGESSVSNAIILATTNYPEKIPHNIIDRPSRFDKVYEIPPPEGDNLAKLLTFLLEREPSIAECTLVKGNSIADLKEISFLVHLYNHTIEKAVKMIKERHDLAKKSFAKPIKVGFGS